MLTCCPTEPLPVASAVAGLGPALARGLVTRTPIDPISRRSPADLPCRVQDPDLWFGETPADLERAKAYCADCPARAACLTGALERHEPWGVWGGEIFERGRIVARKRPRGRPRKDDKNTKDDNGVAA